MSELLTMPTILQSIKPKYCELIASGKKTIEVRKTKPKIPTPFKVYIYCTKARIPIRHNGRILMYEDDLAITNRWGQGKRVENPCGAMMDGELFLNGKVIGEFVCDGIISHCEMANADIAEQQGCIKREDLIRYACGKELYGWHISDLKIYDKPKELNEFYVSCKGNGTADDKMCISCPNLLFDYDELNGHTRWCGAHKMKPLTRPPQSWCYVEEV